MTIKGKFADGTPLLAVPNYARMNRDVASVPAEEPSAPVPARRLRLSGSASRSAAPYTLK